MNSKYSVLFITVSLILCVAQNAQSNSFDSNQIFYQAVMKDIGMNRANADDNILPPDTNSFEVTLFISSDNQISLGTTAFAQSTLTNEGLGFAPDGSGVNGLKLTSPRSGDSLFPNFLFWKNVSLNSDSYRNPDTLFNSLFAKAITLSARAKETSDNIADHEQQNVTLDGIMSSAGFVIYTDQYNQSATMQLTTAPKIGDVMDDTSNWKRFIHNLWGQFDTKSSGSPAPVPEPATMLLFGTGLAGLAGVVIRRNKK